MARIDMHVHSTYSEHPSEWFLQRIGAKESYTNPEYIYETAKKRGMDFVTITDHNRIDGALILKKAHPEEVIVGVESTAYFPEDLCKVHILMYDIDKVQFRAIEELRQNIYELRDYIRSENIAYSVAHATYSVNKKLTSDHLEKLILLFDVFEGINGARSFFFNSGWMETLQALTPEHIASLARKHTIEPFGSESWIKCFTAGSDDHAGIFIGSTYSTVDASTPGEIAECIRGKRIHARGRHNDYKSLAMAIYKIAVDFAKNNNGGSSNSFLYSISENLFQAGGAPLKKNSPLSANYSFTSKNRIGELIMETVETVKNIDPSCVEDRLEIIFAKICDIADEFFKMIVETFSRDLHRGDIASIIMNISSSLPGLFLSLPFLSALQHMNANKDIVERLQMTLFDQPLQHKRKILWFTDTIYDLNGVSETLKELSWISFRNGRRISLVTAECKDSSPDLLPPNTIFVPTFYSLKLPMYENITVHFPSILKAIEMISKQEPTEVYVSTPGPMGLLGLLVARMLNLKCTGIYHTDFAMQVERIAHDTTLTETIERSTRWFYSMMDVIRVPTQEYADLLKQRGFDESKLKFIRKRIDPELFAFDPNARRDIFRRFSMKNGLTLLYVGRISKDKNLDMLCSIYESIVKEKENINLLFVGEGPYLNDLKDKMKEYQRVHFTGRLSRRELPAVYSASDLLVFPSATDTFGMVVMEAQSCCLPALVSNAGGPQEIIINGETGFILHHNDPEQWVDKIRELHELKSRRPASYNTMRMLSRNQVICRFATDDYLEQVIGEG